MGPRPCKVSCPCQGTHVSSCKSSHQKDKSCGSCCSCTAGCGYRGNFLKNFAAGGRSRKVPSERDAAEDSGHRRPAVRKCRPGNQKTDIHPCLCSIDRIRKGGTCPGPTQRPRPCGHCCVGLQRLHLHRQTRAV